MGNVNEKAESKLAEFEAQVKYLDSMEYRLKIREQFFELGEFTPNLVGTVIWRMYFSSYYESQKRKDLKKIDDNLDYLEVFNSLYK